MLAMLEKPITLQSTRQKLGKKAERMTDKEIEEYLNFLRQLCNQAIDAAVGGKV